MRDVRLLVAAALVAPLAAATLGLAAVALAERAGHTPLAALTPANVAEAAAAGRADLVVRFLREGADAARVYSVHPDIISSAVLRATALEAAIWSRQVELVELLDRAGAIPHHQRALLACLADDLGVDDVVEYLSGRNDIRCEPEKAVQAVMARTLGAEAPGMRGTPARPEP